MSQTILRIFGLAPFLTGLYFGWLGVERHTLSFAQSSWHPTQGIVQESEIVNLESKAKTRAKLRAIRIFQPFVAVRYEVSGKTYRFEMTGSGLRKREAALEVLSRYPHGSELQIFYNPQDPAQATLRRSTPSVSYLLYIVCFFCTGMSVLLMRAISSVSAATKQ